MRAGFAGRAANCALVREQLEQVLRRDRMDLQSQAAIRCSMKRRSAAFRASRCASSKCWSAATA
jgi:hypothetical protein